MTFLELEQLCKKRKVKKVIKFLLVLLFIVVVTLIYLNTKPSTKLNLNEVNKSKIIKKTKIITNKNINQNITKDNNITIKSNITKDNNTTKNNKIIKENNNTIKNINTKKKENKTKKSIRRLKLILDLNISNIKVNKTPKKNNINKQQNTNLKHQKTSPVKYVKPEIKKPLFTMKTKTLPSFENCIALSQKYYEEGDYKKALKWAKNANLQNNKKPDSWIMSAKSLYKLGKKQEALKILKIYYNFSKNEKILELIKELNENN